MGALAIRWAMDLGAHLTHMSSFYSGYVSGEQAGWLFSAAISAVISQPSLLWTWQRQRQTTPACNNSSLLESSEVSCVSLHLLLKTTTSTEISACKAFRIRRDEYLTFLAYRIDEEYSKAMLSGSSRAIILLLSRRTGQLVSSKQKLHHQKPPSAIHWQASRSLVTRPYVDSKLSYAYGRSNDHLIYSTVAQELIRQVAETPNEIAYVSHYENKQVSYGEFGHDVNKVAKALVQKFNVSRGDYVGVFAYNCYNWVVVELACARIGAVLTPINPSNKSNELAFILKKGKVKCLFTQGPRSVQSELNDHLTVLQSDEILALDRSGDLKLSDIIFMDHENEYSFSRDSSSGGGGRNSINCKLFNCQYHNWSALDNDGLVFESAQEAESQPDGGSPCIIDTDSLSPDDLFAVYYTSGTTGSPKGACISNFTVINNVRICQRRLRQGLSDEFKMIVVTILPLFHIFAGVLTTLSPLVSNSHVIYANYKYDIKSIMDAITRHRGNVITLTPTILIDLLTYIETHQMVDIPLKIVQSGGAALSPEVMIRALKTLPGLQEIRVGYGSSENGAVATLQTLHEPAELRSITVGPPIDFSEVRIVKPNSDKVVPLGERGEIQTRGHNTMLEYLDQPDKTSEVIGPNRWYKTGDMGLMHPHGSIQINGRLKHMIIKGGENIYPEEVEQLIHKLEYVEDVHVVGVPDKRFGEQVCAWVKLKPGYSAAKSAAPAKNGKNEIHQDDIIEYCKANITYFKVPKYLIFVDEFPMTPTKKVQHHIMTEQSCKILGLTTD